MHAAIQQSAKKLALAKLIAQMRKLELADGADDEDPPKDAGGDGLDELVEHEEDLAGLGDDEGEAEGDPKALLRAFMRQGTTHKPRGRSTITIDVNSAKAGPAAQMKKTFGGGKSP